MKLSQLWDKQYKKFYNETYQINPRADASGAATLGRFDANLELFASKVTGGFYETTNLPTRILQEN